MKHKHLWIWANIFYLKGNGFHVYSVGQVGPNIEENKKTTTFWNFSLQH